MIGSSCDDSIPLKIGEEEQKPPKNWLLLSVLALTTLEIRGKNHDKWMYAAMLDSAIKEVFLRFLRRRQNRIAADTSSESALSSQSVQTYSSFFLKSISESSRSVKLDLLSESSLNLSDSCPS